MYGVYRVLISKFLFEEKSSSGPFVWKSILRSRKLIAKESRWQIGDGKTRIFYDSWLLDSTDGKVTSPLILSHPKLLLMFSLIHIQGGGIQINLTVLCFYPPEPKMAKYHFLPWYISIYHYFENM